ncbi:unnamed protein product [Cladocopium goreaui]|uniref:WD repeat-containing protein 46 (WD repeat-containing protein BING4) n=1 Tax=Cladocopium goreaui TaxID=2562237 RepID=A0A9P1CRB3_9DINO|nr:unnamed protein product [Cladocopium goreaui]
MWYNLYDHPYSTFPDEDGNANLFETVGYLIVAKPKTNSTWDLFHLVPDFGRQTFQHSRPQFGSNDTSAGTSVQDGKPFLGNPTQVIQLDAGEEVPVLSPAERKELQRSSKGKGKGRKGGGKGSKKGKGKGKGEPQAKPDEGLVARVAKYARPTKGTPEELKVKHDRKRKGQAKLNQRLDREAAFRAAKAEVLQTAEPGLIETEEAEDTTRLTQKDILDSAGVGVARKYFSFDLPYGPYNCDWEELVFEDGEDGDTEGDQR